VNAVVDTPTENSPQTVSEIMARMFAIREEKRAWAKREKELNEEWAGLEATLLSKLDEQGSVRVSSRQGTAGIEEEVVPIIEDWDEFTNYMRDNDALYLLQRRIAVGAFRELARAGQEVPGLRAVTKRSIGLTASR
jgi:hypothetical protein